MNEQTEEKKKGPSGKACEVILYPKDGWTADSIVDEIAKRESVDVYSIILHDKDCNPDGTPKEPHFHVYLSFGSTKWYFSDIAAWFNVSINKVEHIKAKGRNARYSYLLYQLHVKEPEKHQYDISDIYANFDVAEYLSQHEHDTSLDQIIDLIAEGTITRLNYTNYIDIHTYAKHKQRIDRAFEYCDASRMASSHGDRSIFVGWVSGPSKSGKTTVVKLFARRMSEALYITEQGNHPFDGYSSQRIVCVDDLRPDSPFSFVELLQILDNHTIRALDARYHNKIPMFEMIFVTSIYSPERFFSLCGEPEEEALQLYRRISEYWQVNEEIISIRKYDYSRRQFVECAVRRNPVPGYLATIQPTTQVDSISVLADLEAQFTNTQLSIFSELPDDDTDNPFV